MIYYIDSFPERFHHPKEDQYLYRILRMRHAGAASLLDRLEAEHRVGAEKIRTLEQALTRYQGGGSAGFSNFLAAVESYAEFHWEHMKAEEQQALPMAEKYLSAADWKEIDAAFLGHSDPMLGTPVRTEFEGIGARRIKRVGPALGADHLGVDEP